MDISSYKDLWAEVKKYLTLQVDYVKLTALEKLTILAAAMVFVCIVIVISACALFFLSAAFVAWLDSILCCTWLANLITCGVVLLLLMIVIGLKKTLIIDPVSRFITKLFMNPPQN